MQLTDGTHWYRTLFDKYSQLTKLAGFSSKMTSKTKNEQRAFSSEKFPYIIITEFRFIIVL